MTTQKMLIAVVLSLAAIASACGGSTPIEGAVQAPVETDAPESTTTADATTTVAETTTEAETTTVAETTTEAETTTVVETTDVEPAVDAALIFEDNCARCHGSDGTGRQGPPLIGIVADHPEPLEFVGLVTNGTPKMPSFGGKLSEAEIEAVSEYARTNF